jgi:hypothetical protein
MSESPPPSDFASGAPVSSPRRWWRRFRCLPTWVQVVSWSGLAVLVIVSYATDPDSQLKSKSAATVGIDSTCDEVSAAHTRQAQELAVFVSGRRAAEWDNERIASDPRQDVMEDELRRINDLALTCGSASQATTTSTTPNVADNDQPFGCAALSEVYLTLIAKNDDSWDGRRRLEELTGRLRTLGCRGFRG